MLTQMDPKQQAEVYALKIQSGQLTINEVRKSQNLPPVEGGDIAFINSAALPVKHARRTRLTTEGHPV